MKQINFFLSCVLFCYLTGLKAQLQSIPPGYPPVSFTGDAIPLTPSSPSANCSQQSADFAYYNNIANYIPTTNTPVKVINVAFNIFQKGSGTSNFKNTPADKQKLIQMLSWINDNYNASDAPSDPVPGVVDLTNGNRKIQFSLGSVGQERIYFYQNTSLWSADCFHTPGVPELEDAAWGNGPQADPARRNYLNIYFTEGDAGNNTTGCAALPWYGDGADLSQVIYKAYSTDSIYGTLWVHNIVMRHELAHNLGIGHTYDCAGGCPCDNIDYWDDFFGPYPPSGVCPHCQVPDCWSADCRAANGDGVTNNVVGANKDQAYASPKEVGQMHRALSLMTTRKYVDPCTYTSLQPININSNQFWDFDIRLYSDLIVQSGNILDLACKVTMPCNSQFKVQSGASSKMEDGAEVKLNSNAAFSVELGGTLFHDVGSGFTIY